MSSIRKTEPTTCVYKEVRYHNLVRHLLETDFDLRVIGLVRHPLAVLASWKKAPKEFKPEWNFASEWRQAPSKNEGRAEEFYGFDKWKEVAQLFQQLRLEFPERFALVEYGNLLNDTQTEVMKLFDFCGLELGPQTETFLSASRSSHQADTYSVFKQRQSDSDWKTELAPELVQTVKRELANTPLSRFATIS